MPVRTDAGGEGYRYPYGDFGADLIESVFNGLPFMERSGPPWARRDRCRKCGAEVPTETSVTEFTLPMRLDSIPEFDVTFTMPARTCSACGAKQISHDRTLEFHVSESLVQAFDAGHVRP